MQIFFLQSGLNEGFSIVARGIEREWKTSDPDEAISLLEELRQFLRSNLDCAGGVLGYLSYDLGAQFVGVSMKAQKDFGTPLLHFILPQEFTFLDHRKDSIDFEALFPHRDFHANAVIPDQSLNDYCHAIDRIHAFLRDGETYEVNFAQRFMADFQGDPTVLFKRLMRRNPSPFSCYLPFEPVTVVSVSPERLVCGYADSDGDRILETRPIKGTVPRGSTPQEDEANRKRLLSSAKEEAELNMIVDLARNDLGKVCRLGSVEVNAHRVIESYSHVHHTVSNIRGVLENGKDWLDVLKAVFPGGSITGAPKKRTMQIIDALEPCARGIYTGSAGFIGFDGRFDFNILIRTIAVYPKLGRLTTYSGGAVVMDSIAQEEYQETLDKAAVLSEAIGNSD